MQVHRTQYFPAHRSPASLHKRAVGSLFYVERASNFLAILVPRLVGGDWALGRGIDR